MWLADNVGRDRVTGQITWLHDRSFLLFPPSTFIGSPDEKAWLFQIIIFGEVSRPPAPLDLKIWVAQEKDLVGAGLRFALLR